MAKRNFKLSLRYARALLRASADKEQVGQALDALAQAYATSHELDQVCLDPSVSIEVKKQLFAKLGLGEDLERFIALLVERRRITLLPQINECYQQELRKLQEVELYTVTSAAELSDEEKKQIESELSKNKKSEITWQVDASLIAGMVIRSSTSVVDASLKGRLKNIKDSLRI